MSSSRAVACCLLNISEARNALTVDRIARAAVAHQLNASPIQTAVLNVFRDKDYNRSVITLASTDTAALKRAVVDACAETFSLIDMRDQVGGHPRLGAVDLIPIHPLTPELSVSDCGQIAREIAETLAGNVPGSSFFVFGPGKSGMEKSLVERRKEVGWFSNGGTSTPPTFPVNLVPDIGSEPISRLGLTGVGAMPYMMNFNATISTTDSRVGKMAANAVRQATGGFPGVRAMAFPHEGNVEVACNVEAVALEEGTEVPDGMTALGGNGRVDAGSDKGVLYHATPEAIREKISLFLKKYNEDFSCDVRVLDGSTIIGYTPSQMVRVMQEAVDAGDDLFYLRQTRRMM